MKWPLLDYWWIAALVVVLLILLGCDQRYQSPVPQYVKVTYSDGSSWEAITGCLNGYRVAYFDRSAIYLLDQETARPMHC